MRRLLTLLFLVLFLPSSMAQAGWFGIGVRDLNDVDKSVDPEDEYFLEWDSTSELYIPRARLDAEEIAIDDVGEYFSVDTVEDALSELADGTTLDPIYLRLDTTNDPITGALELESNLTVGGTVTLSTFTPKSVFFAGTGGLVSQDNPNFNYTDGTDILYAKILSSTALTLSGWTEDSIPFMGGSGYFTEDTSFTYDTDTNTVYSDTYTTANLTLNTNTITSSTGLVSFNDDTISTVGDITDGTITLSGGAVTGVSSINGSGTIDIEDNLDATGFHIDTATLTATGTIQGATLTDGVLSINSGSITSGVDATFSGTVQAEQLTSTDDITLNGILTDSSGTVDLSNNNLTTTGDIRLVSDSNALEVGAQASGDIRAYHDGSDSYVKNTTTGEFIFSNENTLDSQVGKLQFLSSLDATTDSAVNQQVSMTFNPILDMTGHYADTAAALWFNVDFTSGTKAFPPDGSVIPKHYGVWFDVDLTGSATYAFFQEDIFGVYYDIYWSGTWGVLAGQNLSVFKQQATLDTVSFTGSTQPIGVWTNVLVIDTSLTQLIGERMQLQASGTQNFGSVFVHDNTIGSTWDATSTISQSGTFTSPSVVFYNVNVNATAWDTCFTGATPYIIGYKSVFSRGEGVVTGYYSKITAGTTQYSYVSEGGNGWFIDNIKWLYGTGKDASIYWNTTDLIINSENVTASDELQILNFSNVLVDCPIIFTQTDGAEFIDSQADGYLDLGAGTAIRTEDVVIAEDAIYLTQTDGNEYIDSLADGYTDIGATTGIRLNSALTRATGDLYVGNNADVNPAIVFDGDTSDGQIDYDEDNGNFNFNANLFPATDNTYYLGKNDDDSPFAWKGVILADTANGKYYRVEITNGSIIATDLTD